MDVDKLSTMAKKSGLPTVNKSYANASILKNGRVVFNIKGNDFRLVVGINYEKK